MKKVKFDCPLDCKHKATAVSYGNAICPYHGVLLYTDIPESVNKQFRPQWAIDIETFENPSFKESQRIIIEGLTKDLEVMKKPIDFENARRILEND